jgi:hypothetical protein
MPPIRSSLTPGSRRTAVFQGKFDRVSEVEKVPTLSTETKITILPGVEL